MGGRDGCAAVCRNLRFSSSATGASPRAAAAPSASAFEGHEGGELFQHELVEDKLVGRVRLNAERVRDLLGKVRLRPPLRNVVRSSDVIPRTKRAGRRSLS